MILENTKGCLYSNSYVNRAKNMLNTLLNKWDPQAVQLDNRINKITEGLTEDGDPTRIKFNAQLTMEGTMANIFRIFITDLVNNKTYFNQNNELDSTLLIAYIGEKQKNQRKCKENTVMTPSSGTTLEHPQSTIWNSLTDPTTQCPAPQPCRLLNPQPQLPASILLGHCPTCMDPSVAYGIAMLWGVQTSMQQGALFAQNSPEVLCTADKGITYRIQTWWLGGHLRGLGGQIWRMTCLQRSPRTGHGQV